MNEQIESLSALYQIEPELIEIKNIITNQDNFSNIQNYEQIIKKNNQSLYNIKQDIKKFYQEYFILENISYYPFNFSRWKRKSLQQEKIIQSKPTISPFNIPITPLNTQEINGHVLGGSIKINNKDTRLVNEISVTNCDISHELYSHEIAHTQQLTIQNGLNALNEEMISIFIECLAQNYFKNNKNIYYLRLNDLLTKINYLSSHKYTDDEVIIYQKAKSLVYIESTLKAYLLYYLYQTESLTSTQARIIDQINEVFQKQLTIEELLNKQGITRENCKTPNTFSKILKRI